MTSEGATPREGAMTSEGATPRDAESVVRASATALTLLPGGSEHEDCDGEGCPGDHRGNCAEAGDRLNSAIPDYWGRGLDAWFLADKRDSLPRDLDEALTLEKEFPEYPGEIFRPYRLKNHLAVAFPTDGLAIADWDEVSVSLDLEEPSYVCVEGESNAIRRLIRDPPSDFWEWFEGREKVRATRTRIDDQLVEDGDGYAPHSEAVNRVAVDGVEGVRLSTIVGGTDTYIEKLNDLFTEDPVRFLREFPRPIDGVPSYAQPPPAMYTFLELVVLADGASLARLWDASPYPHHYLYLNGQRTDDSDNGFCRGEGRNHVLDCLDLATVDGGNWIHNENLNLERFVPWVLQECTGLVTPFTRFAPGLYELLWDAPLGDFGTPQERPVATLGEDGDRVTAQSLRERFDEPLFPWCDCEE